MNKKLKISSMILVTLAMLAAVTGCAKNPPPEPTLDANAIFTQAAETVGAQLTRTALSMPTATPSFTPTQTPTNTPEAPTATLALNTTPVTGLTPGNATIAPNPNKMEFISDVTIPDGQIVPPGAKFIKTWRIKNVGTTTWTTNFRVRLWAGQQFGAASSILLAREVPPNTETDISIEFTAPLNNGEYMSMWILSDQTEANFGVPFYVKFNVGVTASSTPTNTSVAATAAPTESPAPTATP